MKPGQQLGLLLDSSLHHFKKHGLLLMGFGAIIAVSKWTIYYLLASFNNSDSTTAILGYFSVMIFIILMIASQAGILLQASALINQSWISMPDALRLGLNKVLKLFTTLFLVFFFLGVTIILMSFGFSFLVSGAGSAFLSTIITTIVIIYCALRLTFIFPAIVLNNCSIVGSIKTSFALTNSWHKLTITFIGLAIAMVLLLTLISVPWAILWSISWVSLGQSLNVAAAASSSTGMGIVSGIITICSLFIEAWSVPMFFLISVEIYHYLEELAND